jgi:hypothetical protein
MGYKNFIAQIVRVKKGKIFASFLKSVFTKQFTGFVYNYPDIKDIHRIELSQIRIKLSQPKVYLRSYKLFEIHCNTLQNV